MYHKAEESHLDLCDEIDYLRAELIFFEKQAKYWQKKYSELLDKSLNHNHVMMGHVLTGMLNKLDKIPEAS